MKRTTWLIAYDIRDPKRLGRMHRFLRKQAHAVQYSVFVAELTERERGRLVAALRKRIDPRRDDLRLYAVPPGATLDQLGRRALAGGLLLAGSGAGALLDRGDDPPATRRRRRRQVLPAPAEEVK